MNALPLPVGLFFGQSVYAEGTLAGMNTESAEAQRKRRRFAG